MDMSQIWKPAVAVTTLCVAIGVGVALFGGSEEEASGLSAIELANAARKELMPTAPGFTQISTFAANVSEIYAATDNSGYVITASSNGYGGPVTVMVAFNTMGNINRVKVLSHNETENLGSQITDFTFLSQYTGKTATNFTLNMDVDQVTGCTISSTAANNAINSAIAAYHMVFSVPTVTVPEVISPDSLVEDVLEVPEVVETIDLSTCEHGEQLALLLPNSAFVEQELESEHLLASYQTADKNAYVFVISVDGRNGPIESAFALDSQGSILGVEIIAQMETSNLGGRIVEEVFREQFVGLTEVMEEEEVDLISGATISSLAMNRASDMAFRAFALAKGQEVEDFVAFEVFEEEVAEIIYYTDIELLMAGELGRKEFFPGASGFIKLESDVTNVLEFYALADESGYFVMTYAEGYHGLTPIWVALDASGIVTKVKLYEKFENTDVPFFAEDVSFIAQFLGNTQSKDIADVDLVTGATFSSVAVFEGVALALEAFQQLS